MRNTWLALGIFASLSACASGSKKPQEAATSSEKKLADDTRPAPEPQPAPEARQLLVAFDSEEAAKSREAIFKKHKVKELQKVGRTSLYLVEVAEGDSLPEKQKDLSGEKGIRYVEPNLQMRLMKKR